MPSCNENEKQSGFCGACYAAVRRLVLLPYADIAAYFRKTQRLAARAQVFYAGSFRNAKKIGDITAKTSPRVKTRRAA